MTDLLLILRDPESFARRLGPLPGGLSAACFDHARDVTGDVSQVRAIVGMSFMLDRALIERLPRLEWIQTLTAGTDALAPLGLDPGVAVTTIRGHQPQVAEYVMMQMLALTRDLRGLIGHQDARRWEPNYTLPLCRRRLVIIGVGSIAEQLAARARAFEMHVTGVSDSRTEAPNFDVIVPTSRLREAAAAADFLVPLSPLSERTDRIVSREVIAALRPDAFLINAGRGRLVDEPALVEALRAGRIAGAALDVFEEEPLTPESPLWSLPNALVTPHVGGRSSNFVDQVLPLVRDNLGRWCRGEPLLNLARS